MSHRSSNRGSFVVVVDGELRQRPQPTEPRDSRGDRVTGFPEHRYFVGQHVLLTSLTEIEECCAEDEIPVQQVLGELGTVCQLLSDDTVLVEFASTKVKCGAHMIREVLQ